MIGERGCDTITFSAKIERVTVDVSGSLIVDDQAELRRFMARQ